MINSVEILKKIDRLPPHLRQQAVEYIDYLYSLNAQNPTQASPNEQATNVPEDDDDEFEEYR